MSLCAKITSFVHHILPVLNTPHYPQLHIGSYLLVMSAAEGEWHRDEGWRFHLFTSKNLADSNIFRDVRQSVFDGLKAETGNSFHSGALCQEGVFVGATETNALSHATLPHRDCTMMTCRTKMKCMSKIVSGTRQGYVPTRTPTPPIFWSLHSLVVSDHFFAGCYVILSSASR